MSKRKDKKTQDKARFVSLRWKFALVLVVSAVTTLVLALLLIPLVLNLVLDVYTSQSQVDKRLNTYIQNFAEYVIEEDVRSDDAASVVKWTKLHRYVHLVVFEGDEAQFGVAGGEILPGDETPVMDPIFTDIISEENDQNDVIGNTYAVRFADRICSVSVVDYSASMMYDSILMGGIIIAISCFFLVMIFYYHKQINAIVALSGEVERISGGELTADIDNHRNDEIGNLARDVDTMRTTIITKMDEEREAWLVNSQLITSMSHDIRTPLTTLLGYMELLSADTQNLTPEQKAYVSVCAAKAEQIKGLSDKLFLYFWAYHRGEEDVPLEVYPAALLFEQMLGEWLLPMEGEGFSVQVSLKSLPHDAQIMVNVDCLRRIMDNLFDNIRKYADRAAPVCVSASVISAGEQPQVCLSISNKVGQPKEGSSGTHVGHRTCANMAELMNGEFSSQIQGDIFVANICLSVTADVSTS